MAYIVLSDIHFHNWSQFAGINTNGINTRLQFTLNAMRQVAAEAVRRKIRRMYIAGDLFHVRGSLIPSVLNPTIECFREITARGITVRAIPGNHDLETADSCKLASAANALWNLIDIAHVSGHYEDDRVVMVPWFHKLTDLLREIRCYADNLHNPGQYDLIIHAPLNGVISGIPDHGLDASELNDFGFRRVFVGHYHNHKAFGDVYSIGALTHQTWSDVGTRAGYLVVGDTVEQIETDAPKFVDFDDRWMTAWSKDDIRAQCEGNFVRVKLGEATEAEIKAVREKMREEYGARDVVVNAQPKPTTPTRASASVAAGARLEVSIEEWLRHNLRPNLDMAWVQAKSLELLNKTMEA